MLAWLNLYLGGRNQKPLGAKLGMISLRMGGVGVWVFSRSTWEDLFIAMSGAILPPAGQVFLGKKVGGKHNLIRWREVDQIRTIPLQYKCTEPAIFFDGKTCIFSSTIVSCATIQSRRLLNISSSIVSLQNHAGVFLGWLLPLPWVPFRIRSWRTSRPSSTFLSSWKSLSFSVGSCGL